MFTFQVERTVEWENMGAYVEYACDVDFAVTDTGAMADCVEVTSVKVESIYIEYTDGSVVWEFESNYDSQEGITKVGDQLELTEDELSRMFSCLAIEISEALPYNAEVEYFETKNNIAL